MEFDVVMGDPSGTVQQFEDQLIRNAAQAQRTSRHTIWIELAEIYYRQKERLKYYPYPEDFNKKIDEDETPPVIKRIVRNHKIEGLFRWGVKYKTSGNHRILYIIHNHYKVVLLHYFDKQYNGDIRREDIKRAEDVYESYCSIDPSLY